MHRLILLLGLSWMLISSCTEQTVKSEDALVEGRALSASDYLSVRILPEKAELAAGRRLPFSIVGILPYGNNSDLTEQGVFSSSDPEIVEFAKDSPGTVIAMKAGKTTVTFTFGTLEASTEVTVSERIMDQLHLSPDSMEIAIDKINNVYEERRITLKANGIFSDASSQELGSEVTWTLSSEASIKPVAGLPGVYATKAPGTTQVTASVGDKVQTRTIDIIQGKTSLKSLSMNPVPFLFPLQTARSIEVTATYTDGTTAIVTDIADYSLNPSALAVLQTDANGALQIASQVAGNGTLTVSYKELSSDFLLAAVDPEASVLRLVSGKNFTMAKGEVESFQVWLDSSDGSTENITTRATWKVGNASTLGAVTGVKGRYTASRAGSTTVSATLGSLTVSHPVTIGYPGVASIAITSASSGTLGLYQIRDYVATATYTDATTRVVTDEVAWSFVTGSATGTFDATVKGRFQGTASGTGTVKATLNSVMGTANVVVGGVIPVSLSLQASWTTLSLATGAKQLSSFVVYSDGSTQNMTSSAEWNYEIVGSGLNFAGYVNNSSGSKGICVPLATGFYKVTATYGGFRGEKSIQVTP